MFLCLKVFSLKMFLLCSYLLWKRTVHWGIEYFKISLERSNRPNVFCKKGVLRNFVKLKENTCARVSFLIKLQSLACNYLKRKTLTQVFSCELCEISKNSGCHCLEENKAMYSNGISNYIMKDDFSGVQVIIL